MQVQFAVKDSVSGKNRYGTITAKPDGKYSISIFQSREYSPASNYRVKKVAEEIISSSFKHPSITQITGKVDEELFEDLVSKLTEQTQVLKQLFLEKTTEFANNKFKWAESHRNFSYEDFVTRYGKSYYQTREDIRIILTLGYNKFLEKELKNAEDHYTNSIYKLAQRLAEKGINTDFEMTTSRLGVNIDTIIKSKDGSKTITASTIVASGPIQRPHYRYLIK